MSPGRLLIVLGLLASATACDRKPSNAPSPPLPTVTSLALAGADAVLTGVSATYIATATFADGTTQTGTTVWTSSNPDVASVDAGGRLEGRAQGSTTLTATYLGRSASKTVRVVSNYGGTWVGRYVINSCDAPRSLCAVLEWEAFSFPLQLEVSHSGNYLDEISAVLIFSNRQIRATVSGSVTADGRLSLAGDSNVADRRGRIWATLHVGTWDTSLSGGGTTMTGGWAQRLSVLEPRYDEYQQNGIETMTRVSTSMLPASH